MNGKTRIYLSLLSGLLLGLGWPHSGSFTPLLFVFLVPLLIVENDLYRVREFNSSRKIFPYALLTFGLANLITSWWVFNAHWIGLFAIILVNGTLMSMVLWMFHYTRKHVGSGPGYISLVIFWLGFEYFHLDWDLSWPWMQLGNGFARIPEIVQWYDVSGVMGGTLWILIGNLISFKIINAVYVDKVKFRDVSYLLTRLVLILIVPIVISLYKYSFFEEKEDSVEVVLVQPNIDPYGGKFVQSPMQQLNLMLALADSIVDDSTDYIVFPETSLLEFTGGIKRDGNLTLVGLWEEYFNLSETKRELGYFLNKYPNLKIVSGLISKRMLDLNVEPPPSARFSENMDLYYEVFNAAVQIDTSSYNEFYHKRKLVMGVESMPFAEYLSFLKEFTLELGGTYEGYGKQLHPTIFDNPQRDIKVAPIICYESVYGDLVNEFVRDGANLIFIMTNDGWWGNTPGYRQHLSYARLRAIETRRSIARSANTGISAVINQKGDVQENLPYWEAGVLKAKLNKNSELTFYTKHGDFIGRVSWFLFWLIIVYATVKGYQYKVNRKNGEQNQDNL